MAVHQEPKKRNRGGGIVSNLVIRKKCQKKKDCVQSTLIQLLICFTALNIIEKEKYIEVLIYIFLPFKFGFFYSIVFFTVDRKTGVPYIQIFSSLQRIDRRCVVYTMGLLYIRQAWRRVPFSIFWVLVSNASAAARPQERIKNISPQKGKCVPPAERERLSGLRP